MLKNLTPEQVQYLKILEENPDLINQFNFIKQNGLDKAGVIKDYAKTALTNLMAEVHSQELEKYKSEKKIVQAYMNLLKYFKISQMTLSLCQISYK